MYRFIFFPFVGIFLVGNNTTISCGAQSLAFRFLGEATLHNIAFINCYSYGMCCAHCIKLVSNLFSGEASVVFRNCSILLICLAYTR